MLHELQHAFRTLRRRPSVSLLAMLTLAAGIAAVTAVYAVVDAVVLQPLPFEQPDRLVRIYAVTPEGQRFSMSDAEYLDLRGVRALAGVAAFREVGSSRVLNGPAGPVRIQAVPLSASAPSVLGVSATVGRTFTPDEDRPGAEPRLLLAHSTWLREFGGDESIVGRPVVLDDRAAVVVGVMPPAFDFPGSADAWVPLAADAAGSRDDRELTGIARLAPGVDVAGAAAELRIVGARLAAADPASRGWSLGAIPLQDWLVAPRYRDAVWMLFGAVTLLMLLACANVANLLLAHASTRGDELRVRAALGASHGRLIRQLLAESSLLAAFGTLGGVLLAGWVIDLFRTAGSGRIPRIEGAAIDGHVLGFACVAGALAALLAGAAPALRGARAASRHAGQSIRHTAGGRRLRQGLVAIEVALALLLMIGATLLASSFLRLMRVDDGFDAQGAVAMTIDLPGSRYGGGRAGGFYDTLLERLRVLPGVSGAGATSTAPFRQFGFSNDVTAADRLHEGTRARVEAGWRSVTPGFFETLRIPILAGRAFGPTDGSDSPRVVVVSQALAHRLWPGQSAVGREIYWGGTTGRTRTVIGVAGDIRDVSLDTEPPPMLFVPHAQVPVPSMTIVVRSSLDGTAAAVDMRRVVRELDPGLPAPEVHALAASRAGAEDDYRFTFWMVAMFAAAGLVLAMSGVYGTLALTVTERRRELALRIALGATRRDVLRLVLGGGLAFTVLGITAGTAAALAAVGALESLLYGVEPTDPASFAAAAGILLATAAFACYVPARRAAAVDPALLLRD